MKNYQELNSANEDGSITTRFPHIDGLRAIAVLAVLAYHLEFDIFPNGFLGVDLFFVISGYVVCRSLTATGNSNHSMVTYLEHFYRRRFWRLIPALAVMVITTLILSMLFVPPSYLSRHIFFTAAGAVTGVSNIVLALASGTNYFDQATGYNPLIHTWSLGVEEQFYMLFPFIIWFSTRRWIWQFVLPVIAVFSILLAMLWSSDNQNLAFYTLPARLWELTAGALAYKHSSQARAFLIGNGAVAVGWFGMALVFLCLINPFPVASPFPGAILPTLGIVLVLLYAAPNGSETSRRGLAYWISGRAAVYIGRISYSLYLWHWPVIVFMRWTIGFADMVHSLLAFLLSLVLAVASYHFIEQPFQKAQLAGRMIKPISLKLAAACVVLFSIMVLMVGSSTDYSAARLMGQLSVVQRQFGWNSVDLPSLGRQIPPVGQAGQPTLILIGDSHARHLAGAAIAVAAETGLEYRLVSDCGYTLLKPVINESCMDIIDEAKAGDVVVFSSLNIPRFVDQDGTPLPEPNFDDPKNANARYLALEQFIGLSQVLKTRGVTLVYRGPEPLFRFIPLRCSDWFNRVNAICANSRSEPRSELLARAEPVNESISIVAGKVQGVVVLNVFDVLCPNERCNIYGADGNPMFFDQDHLSGWGAEKLVPSLKKAVMDALASVADTAH